MTCGAGRVAVGTSWGPVAGQDGAPYAPLGWIDHRLRIGGLDPSNYHAADGTRLFLFDDEATCRAPIASKVGGGGWRGLELAGSRVYEHHAGIGPMVTAIEDDSFGTPEWAAPTGFAVTEAVPSLALEGRLWCGMDPAGSVPRELLWWSPDAGLRSTPAEDPEDSRLGLLLGAQWLEADGTEHLLVGEGFSLRLVRARSGGEPSSSTVLLPQDPDGSRGHTYLDCVKSGDLIAWTRAGSSHGLVLSSASSLVADARTSSGDEPLEVRALAQVRTHARGTDRTRWTWEPVILETSGGRLVLALPVGVGGDERSRTLLVDVTGWREGRARVLGELSGSLERGHAMAVAGGTVGGRTILFVGDLAGAVERYEVDGEGRARSTGVWLAPEHPIDGHRENVLDLELETEGGRVALWVAAGRGGLIALDPRTPSPRLVHGIDTPGWAMRLRVVEDQGVRALFLGDQKCGLRVYR